ncbi:MAG TPA: hypothetical protein VGR02_14695 [Thermoanaerobaculia bacterium]|jgi:hypothetical protein|nr:hypothetical protein [Thermoanaerobaculia bacterium]
MKYIALPALLLAACASTTTAHVGLPDAFTANAERVPMKRSAWTHSKSPLTIGSYKVVSFHDAKKTHVKSSNVVPIYLPDPTHTAATSKTTRQTITFVLNEAGQPRWDTECQVREHAEGFTSKIASGDVRSNRDMVCTFKGADGFWTMTTWGYHNGMQNSVKGELTDGTSTWELQPIYEIRGENGSGITLPVPIGFALKNGGETVAATDTVGSNQGSLLVSRNLEPQQKSIAAASLAAVLLQLEDRGGRVIPDLW